MARKLNKSRYFGLRHLQSSGQRPSHFQRRAAHAFLNFIHEPANQAKETETIRYATPNDEAMKLVPEEILNDLAARQLGI